MKIYLPFLMMALGLMLGASAVAQPRILKQARENLPSASDRNNTTRNAPAQDAATQDAARDATRAAAQGGNAPQAASVAPAAQTPDMASAVLSPSIAWYSLLENGCYDYYATTGYFRPNGFYVFFLPERDTKGQPMNYSDFSAGPYLRMDVVQKPANAVKATFYFYAQPEVLPAYKMQLCEKANNPKYPSSTTLTEGEYSFDFYVGEHKITSFPVWVEKQMSANPYSPVKHMYWMRGAWENWARLGFNTSGEFQFSFYLPQRNIKVENQAKWDDFTRYPYKARLFRNGALVGQHDLEGDGQTSIAGVATAENGRWYRNENTFWLWPPREKLDAASYNRIPFQRADLTDGDYAIETEIEKPDGTEKARYVFRVRGGEIISHPDTDRTQHADPLTLVEQGPDFKYIPKQ